ncbi:hypothetical protein BJY01DRAFT_250084 [Aspergillus pseudoustus]|uniref:Uncharacterized protein n=1 Tax=Aspergillus pseudoustus TaxID=1810923 RepID=A0ABR4JJV7_9EURO
MYETLFKGEVRRLDQGWFGAWDGLWTDIRAMKGLVDVCVWIRMEQEREREHGQDGTALGSRTGNVMSVAQEARLFEPLMRVTSLRNFNVEVTWPANEASVSLVGGADEIYMAVTWTSSCPRPAWADSADSIPPSGSDGADGGAGTRAVSRYGCLGHASIRIARPGKRYLTLLGPRIRGLEGRRLHDTLMPSGNKDQALYFHYFSDPTY